MKEIRWTQWSKHSGMIGCGYSDYNTLMKWMRELGQDASRCLKNHKDQHAVYGIKIYDEQDEIEEIRFYVDCYMTDEELNAALMYQPRNVFYVAHKMGGIG